jgi:hypothetical protein
MPIGRVTPGGCPPGVPTDPYVRISRIRLFRSGIRGSYPLFCVNMNSGFDAPFMSPSNGPLTRASPFLPGVPQVSVPPAHRYYGMLRHPVVLPAVLRFLRLAVPSPAPVFVSPRCPTPAGGLVHWGAAAPSRPLRTGDAWVSQVPGEPSTLMPCSPTPAGPRHQANYRVSTRPLLFATARAPTINAISGLNSRA